MLKYYFSSDVEPVESQTNEGAKEVTKLLDELNKLSVPVEQIDVVSLTAKERADAYADAVRVSVVKKYRIRQVFGSRRISGTSFGNKVPALIIRNFETGSPEEVYPRQETGGMVTTAAFLRAYLGELSKHKKAA